MEKENSMDLIIRNKDMITGQQDLIPIYTFKKFPVYMGIAEHDALEDKFVDMEWMISKSSGMIQLKKLVPEEVLYKYSHNSGYGTVWMDHYKAFSHFIHKNSEADGGVLEIGGGNGLLNLTYISKYGKVPWTIIEPSNVEAVSGCHAVYIRKMWDTKFAQEEIKMNFHVLIHSHVLEHLYDLNEFMEQNARILKNGQRMLFSVPNLKETLRRKYTNALNFEHTYFITEDYIDYILALYGFQIAAKEYFREEHSIFYAVEKSNKIEPWNIDFDKLFTYNRSLFDDYVQYHKKLILQFNNRMEKEDRPIYLFGAHIFSQYLINFGLNTSKIVNILDNDLLKQKKRLYGTQLLVESPKILKNEQKPIVILKAATYADEIKDDILVKINADTEFWE